MAIAKRETHIFLSFPVSLDNEYVQKQSEY